MICAVPLSRLYRRKNGIPKSYIYILFDNYTNAVK